ncbi:MAG: FtsX-like permease family protein, partial [bacterium]
IILADEPTGALDKESQDIILKILAKIVQSGKLVIIVTHSEVVANYCNRIVRIDDGVVASDIRKAPIKEVSQYEKVIMPKPIKTIDVARLSFQNLMKKKSRTLMVSTGLAIGIAAVILILNLGLGLKQYVKEVYVDNLQSMQIAVSQHDGTVFTDDDLNEIMSIDGISHLYRSVVIDDATYAFNEFDGDVDSLSGYYRYYYPVILYGEMADADDEIVVNESFASSLSDTGMIAAVGYDLSVTYDGVISIYTITGIYEDHTESSDGFNALIGGSVLSTIVDLEQNANILYVTLEDVTCVGVAMNDLESLGYAVYQEDNSANFLLEYIDLGTQILTGVGAISMVVAAIMIFIVLYISIVERTKEIGILRAIGARKRDISSMFIWEAGIIGLAGGVMAVLFSIAITVTTNAITELSLQTSLIAYSIPYYLLGLVLSFIVSILAGISPAVKAADLDPVVALRFE